MESFFNYTNTSTNELYYDVPLLATILKIVMLLMMIPTIISPALLVIHVIWKNEQLHTKYYYFVVNLLAGDVALTGRYGLEFISMMLYLFGLPSEYGDTTYIIISIPRFAFRYSFVLLAIDRVICIVSPYRHHNIMTTKVVYLLISTVWLVACVVAFVVKLTSTFTFDPPFGKYVISNNFRLFVLCAVLLPNHLSVITTIFINAYLYYCTVQSNKRLQENMRLDGRNYHEIRRTRRLLHNLHMQAKPTISVLLLGGIDCVFSVLQSIIISVAITYAPGSTRSYFSLVGYSLDWFQLVSHSLVYGFYMKDIRRQLQKYTFYQSIQRLCPLRASRVFVLNTHQWLTMYTITCFNVYLLCYTGLIAIPCFVTVHAAVHWWFVFRG